MRENTDQKNSEYGHFLGSEWHAKTAAYVLPSKRTKVTVKGHDFQITYPTHDKISMAI